MKHKLRALVPLLACASLLSLGLAFSRPAAQQSEVEIQVHPVAGGVSYLVGEGGNIGLSVGPDGVLMIDSQFLRLAPRIETAIAGLAEQKPAFLLNTHWHGDHTGGNPHFGASATIVAHANVRRRLAGDASIGGRVAQPVEQAGLPELTFDDGVTLHFNGEEVRVQHFPNAHTDGDGVVWFRGSNVVHMGDLYFQIGYPYIDLDSGGSVQGLIEAVNSVLEELPRDAMVIPGHGEVTGVQGLREYAEMLENLSDRVRAGLGAGKTADELAASGLTADFDARWGGFDFVKPADFVRTLARSLSER